jgi:hypothetical protein
VHGAASLPVVDPLAQGRLLVLKLALNHIEQTSA